MADGYRAMPLALTVNGTRCQVEVTADDTLLDVLRDRLHLYGCRETCGIGVCGSCTVRMDGRAISACLVMAFSRPDAEVETVEGLSRESLHPVQQTFVDEQAFQCSFCTPGFVMSVVSLLAEEPEHRDVDAALSGHLCRCGSYNQIRAAVCELTGSRVDMAGPDDGARRPI